MNWYLFWSRWPFEVALNSHWVQGFFNPSCAVFCVEQDYPFKLPYGHIGCKSTSPLNELCYCLLSNTTHWSCLNLVKIYTNLANTVTKIMKLRRLKMNEEVQWGTPVSAPLYVYSLSAVNMTYFLVLCLIWDKYIYGII